MNDLIYKYQKWFSRKLDNLGRIIINKKLLEDIEYNDGETLYLFFIKYLGSDVILVKKENVYEGVYGFPIKLDGVNRFSIPIDYRKVFNLERENVIIRTNYLKGLNAVIMNFYEE